MVALLDTPCGAHISEDGVYRYALWRRWGRGLPNLCWIGLNPSTADGQRDDPTLRRIMRFTTDWGYGGLILVNLYAYRSTDPDVLHLTPYWIGDQNKEAIDAALALSECVVACWGAHPAATKRAPTVTAQVKAEWDLPLICLGKTRRGAPLHPLYVKRDTPRRPYP